MQDETESLRNHFLLQLEKLTEEYKSLQSTLEDKNETIESFKEELAGLQEQNERLRLQLQEQRNTFEKEKNAALTELTKRFQSQLEKLNKEFKDETIASSKEELARLQEQNEQLRLQLKEQHDTFGVTEQFKRLKNASEVLQTKNEQLLKQINELDLLNREKDSQIQKLKTSLQHSKQEYQAIKASLSRLEQGIGQPNTLRDSPALRDLSEYAGVLYDE